MSHTETQKRWVEVTEAGRPGPRIAHRRPGNLLEVKTGFSQNRKSYWLYQQSQSGFTAGSGPSSLVWHLTLFKNESQGPQTRSNNMSNNVGTSYLASLLDLASARKAGAWKDREVLGRPSAAKSAKK